MVLPVEGETGWAAKLNAEINDKAPMSHGHVIADVTDLSNQLAGKAPLVHTHAGGGGGTSFMFPAMPLARNIGLNGGWVTALPFGGISLSNRGGAGNSQTPVVMPFSLTKTIVVDQLAIKIDTAGAAGAITRVGIWNSSAEGKPTTVALDSGAIATDTTGVKTVTFGPAITLPPGDYWVGSVSTGGRYEGFTLPRFALGPSINSPFVNEVVNGYKEVTDATIAAANPLPSLAGYNFKGNDNSNAGAITVQLHLSGDPA